MSLPLILSLLAAAVSIGGILIGVGVFKSKINQNAEVNKTQEEQIKTLATKDELASAIRRSDEMLDIMRRRSEEDREKGQGQWREFHGVLSNHAERIKVLENQQNTLMKSLDEIKVDIKTGFRETQDELKELRNLR